MAPIRQGGGTGFISKPSSPAPSDRAAATTGDRMGQFPHRDLLFAAGGAFNVGDAVMFDFTNDENCRTVIKATSGSDAHVVGIYGDESGRGEGGSGAATTRTGMSGKQAVAGDPVTIRVSGIAAAHVGDDGTTDIDVGDVLIVDATAGDLTIAVAEDPVTGERYTFLALEDQDAETAAKKLVLVNTGF